MKNIKRVKISRFNNQNMASNSIVVKNFYNFLPTEQLNNSMGVKIASFPKTAEDTIEMELNISGAGISSVDGVAYFKQYFPESGLSTHRLLIYGNDKKVYINELFCEDSELYWVI